MDRVVFKGRGSVNNPASRYLSHETVSFDDGWTQDERPVKLPMVITSETTKKMITTNDSPDISFDQSINPYKGCEHGCIYCFARPTHAYLGLSPGLDFETKIVSKPGGPQKLEEELSKPGYRCKIIALGANTDAYQPIERNQKITRRVVEVLSRFNHPVVIITKSQLVLRDLDLLVPMAQKNLVSVRVSVTTLDRKLALEMEPRAATPERRLETIRTLSEAGIPVGVLAAPMIPGLTDHELESILERGREAGATAAGYVLLRLPLEIKDLFSEWLQEKVPTKAQNVLHLIRETREGALYQSGFGTRMRGTGAYAELLEKRFDLAYERLGFNPSRNLDTRHFSVPPKKGDQLSFF